MISRKWLVPALLPLGLLLAGNTQGQDPIFHLNFSGGTIQDMTGMQTIDVGSDLTTIADGGPEIDGNPIDAGVFPDLGDNALGSVRILPSSSMDAIGVGSGSFVAWVKPDAPQVRFYYFGNGDGEFTRTTGMEIIATGSGDTNAATQGWDENTGAYLVAHGPEGLDDIPDAPFDEWTHMAVVWDAESDPLSPTITVYFDGVAGDPVVDTFVDFGSNPSNLNWDIGASRAKDWKAWPGQLADVAFYDVPLTEQQVNDIMTNGVPVTDPGLAGDFDGDGDVDGNDFLVWQRDDATSGNLTVWQDNFGAVASVPATAAVPEPSTLLLLSCGAIGLVVLRRRSH